MKRCVAYVRVSTANQDTDSQLIAIKHALDKAGDVLVNIYKDHGISGAKGRDGRPGLDQMLRDASEKKFDKVVAFDLTRLGRSLSDLLATMKVLSSAQVDLQLLQNELDTSTHSGRLMFSIFGAIGEFERELIRERVKSGLQKAKKQGKKLGRPSLLNDSTKAAVIELKAKGLGVKQICRLLKIGCGTYYTITNPQEKMAA
jgi:DNA invertase Pin-like site-specific DNA recombinase